jgi:hypothetical protein
MGECGFDVTGLPGPDDALARGGDQPYRPVGVDTSESVWIIGRRGGDLVWVGSGCRSGPRPWPRGRGGPGLVAGLFRRHDCRHLPFARLRSAHLPRVAAPSTRGPPDRIPPVLKQFDRRASARWRCSLDGCVPRSSCAGTGSVTGRRPTEPPSDSRPNSGCGVRQNYQVLVKESVNRRCT